MPSDIPHIAVEEACNESVCLEDALCRIAILECVRMLDVVQCSGICSLRMATAFDTVRKEWDRVHHPTVLLFTIEGSG